MARHNARFIRLGPPRPYIGPKGYKRMQVDTVREVREMFRREKAGDSAVEAEASAALAEEGRDE